MTKICVEFYFLLILKINELLNYHMFSRIYNIWKYVICNKLKAYASLYKKLFMNIFSKLFFEIMKECKKRKEELNADKLEENLEILIIFLLKKKLLPFVRGKKKRFFLFYKLCSVENYALAKICSLLKKLFDRIKGLFSSCL